MSEEVPSKFENPRALFCAIWISMRLFSSQFLPLDPLTLQPLPHPTLQPLPHPSLVVPYVVLLIRSSLCLLMSILHSPLSLNHSGKTSRVVLCEIITKKSMLWIKITYAFLYVLNRTCIQFFIKIIHKILNVPKNLNSYT